MVQMISRVNSHYTIMLRCQIDTVNRPVIYFSMIMLHAELRFVTTVATGGRAKFVPAVQIFPENNAFSCKICLEV